MKTVIVSGAASLLVEARANVLRLCSFPTVTALGIEALEALLEGAYPALVILCNSYDLFERRLAYRIVAHRLPGIPVLTLMRATEWDETLQGELLTSLGDPSEMVSAALRLTGGGPASLVTASDDAWPEWPY